MNLKICLLMIRGCVFKKQFTSWGLYNFLVCLVQYGHILNFDCIIFNRFEKGYKVPCVFFQVRLSI